MTTRPELKTEIVNLMAELTHLPPAKIKEDDGLSQRYRLPKDMRAGLALNLSKIAESHGGTSITRAEALNCGTVKDCIELVLKHVGAGGKS